MRLLLAGTACLFGMACSGSDSAGGSTDGEPSSAAGALNPCGAAPDAATPEVSPYVTFVDCVTGFRTDEVHDADREIVHFDATLEAMISAASGVSVGGWTVAGSDLDWSRSGVPFRVRFGTEEGERRAYFTEAGPGTICNLTVAGPDVLFISATRETPPNP